MNENYLEEFEIEEMELVEAPGGFYDFMEGIVVGIGVYTVLAAAGC